MSELFLPFEFIETLKGNYSMGPAVYMIYGNIIVYVLIMAYILVRYGKTLVRKTRAALGITFSTFIIISIFQAITPTALISSLGFTIMCLYVGLANSIGCDDDVVFTERTALELDRLYLSLVIPG